MRVLLCLRHPGLFRLSEPTMRELLARGHELQVRLESRRYRSAAFERLVEAEADLSSRLGPAPARGAWSMLDRIARRSDDLAFFAGAEFGGSERLRERAARRLPRPLARTYARHPARWARLGRLTTAFARAVERRRPVSPQALEQVRGADLVVVSPLFGSPFQVEAVRAARAAGVPSAQLVSSWDNLTSKGRLPVRADLLVVWNEPMRDEALRLHGTPPERLAVCGAPSFDDWFDREPALARAELCDRAGLDPALPYLLYLGSSPFVAKREDRFVRELVGAMRGHDDERIRGLQVLVRPHPQNAGGFAPPPSGVSVWPHPASLPELTGSADYSRQDLFDSIHHSAVVAGVNTTAMIESAALGRRALSPIDARFRGTQRGAPHFEHLGAMVRVCQDRDEFWRELLTALNAGPDEAARAAARAFTAPPAGADSASAATADALERIAGVASGQLEQRPEGGRIGEPGERAPGVA